jgi:aminotransferase EvaB
MELIPVNDLSRWDPSDFSEIKQAMIEVAESGYFMRGPKNKALEDDLGKLLNDRNVVCVANGTDALALALLSLGIKPGDKIACTPNAGGYGTGAVIRVGALPVLVDVELETAQISAEALELALISNPEIRAVLVTHLYGLMANMSQISRIVDKYGLLLIEDCAQAIGASQSGIPAGAWGNASTFSFYPTKNLACIGDGGAVAFADIEHAELCRQLSQYGWSERYVISNQNGINSRLDEIQAAVILNRLKNLTRNNNIRRSIVNVYSESLSSERRMIWQNSESYIGHLAVMVSDRRNKDIEKLREANIGYGIHYPVLDHIQPAWLSIFPNVKLPNSEKLVESIVTLPCFPLLGASEINRVAFALKTL